jgi:PAS domain S-box-containing protein
VNEFEEGLESTPARRASERGLEHVRQRGGVFVEAVRVTRMPMLVTDATLLGNPITLVNPAFVRLSGYEPEELLGQNPHFMNGPQTDPEAIARYEAAMSEGRDETLEILQYRKDGSPFRAMLYATPLDDGQGRVINHFLSYLDITRRYDAEEALRTVAAELERRVEERTRTLEAANAALKKADAEREMLLVEVNHRAKNSLSVAASLLRLQGRRQADALVRSLFEESADRLNAMARVHDMLSRSEHARRWRPRLCALAGCGSTRRRGGRGLRG